MTDKKGIDVKKLPQARYVRDFYCEDEVNCGRLHVVLLDENHNPIAQFVPPDDWAVIPARQPSRRREWDRLIERMKNGLAN